MKRDLDLIRSILLAIESDDTGKLRVYKLASDLSVSPDLIWYHVQLLRDAKFICIRGGVAAFTPQLRKYSLYTIRRMTFAGCDYLDAIKNDTVWNHVKENLKKVGGSTALDVVKELAIKASIQLLQK